MTYSSKFGAVLAASVCVVAIVAPAHAQARQFNIRSGSLKQVLEIYTRQTGQQILYKISDVRTARSPGVRGSMSDAAALKVLLAGTGFEARSDPSGAFAIGRVGNAARLGTDDQSSGSLSESEPNAGPGEEIVVTAQKREQRLQDVPVPVSVVSPTELARNNQVRLQDFASTVPGLSVMSLGNGGLTSITIRGVSSGAYTPATVAITIDDVPSYSGLASALTAVRPDLDPSDLARIEVLRGPQGTLYGASSMGGLINYVTLDPSTDSVSGRVEVGASNVRFGDKLGYTARGSVNIPLSGTLAARASAFVRRDPGYIDNVLIGKEDVNESRVAGGRVSALWKPLDNVSLKVSALYQHFEGDGQSEVQRPTAGFPATAGLVGFQQSNIRNTGQYDQDFQSYSAILKARFGKVDLTSISAYNHTKFFNTRDVSASFGSFSRPVYGVGTVGIYNSGYVSRFNQELRASAPIGSAIEWMVGGFYTHEDRLSHQEIPVLDAANGSTIGSVGYTHTPNTYIELAAFTNVTLHITDKLSLQLGGRQSQIKIKQKSPAIVSGLIAGGATRSTLRPTTTDDVFTYLVTPQYTFSPDLMLYARLASGFRSGGGFNPVFLTDPTVPEAQNADKTKNYEVGIKGSLFDRALSFDLSVYYIDWKDILLTLVTPGGLSYGTNGSAAKSEGVEFSVQAKPSPGLTVNAWVTYSNAVLTESLGASSTAFGPAGSRLPYGTRYSGNLSIKQTFPISDDATGYLGGSASYVGDSVGNFLGTSAPRQVYPDYVRLDLNAGVDYGPWSASIYINNVTDKRALVGGGVGVSPVFGFYYLQPRNIGFTLSRSF